MDNFSDGELTTVSFTAACPLPPDRRQHLRQLSVLRAAKMRTRHGEHLCLVRNISAGGLMAHIYSNLKIGDAVVAEFKSGREVQGVIAWLRDGLAGVQFDQLVNVAHLLSGADYSPTSRQVRAPRMVLNVAARVRVGANYRSVSLLNISQGGANIRPAQIGETGQQLVLMAEGLPAISGTVRWHDCDQAGIQFDNPIPFEVLAQWLAGPHLGAVLSSGYEGGLGHSGEGI